MNEDLLTSCSYTCAFIKPKAYLKGIHDAEANHPRNLNAFPMDGASQAAYEYGWTDTKEGVELRSYAFSIIAVQ